MNDGASTTATHTAHSAQAQLPIALWALVAALVAIGITVLMLDASITTEQRIALLIQSGISP